MSITITKDMDGLRFANCVRGLNVDSHVVAAALARDRPADRCLLVFFTPRSGSSWLTKIVSATRQLGFLEEYINPAFVRDVATQMHATDQATLLAMLLRCARTDNLMFSMELRAVDVALFGEVEFFAAFDGEPVVFVLWRDNIVAQGISLYRAVATRRYHSTEAPTPPPAYDAAQIARWMRHVVGIENANLTLLRKRGIPARYLCYEEMVQDHTATLTTIASAMRVTLAADRLASRPERALEKIADAWNQDTEDRFRTAGADFIRALEATRLIRHHIDTSQPA
jgi:LPS sulfotransferase NodH